MRRLYIEKKSRDANSSIFEFPRKSAMLECTRTFYNKRAVVKLEKHITSFCRRKEKKYMYRAIESESDVYRIIRVQEQRSKRHDYYLIIKLRITFNRNRLHRYD